MSAKLVLGHVHRWSVVCSVVYLLCRLITAVFHSACMKEFN